MNFLKSFSSLLQVTATVLFLGFITSSCDEINGPYKEEIQTGGDTTVAVRKVLLQEFTGHRCGQCPEGNDKAKELKEYYGDRLILMSIHAGFFSETFATGKYSYDFRTPSGDQVNTEYGVSAYPSAIINRTNHQVFVGTSAWATVIDTILAQEPEARITITPTLTESTRELKVDVKTKFVKPIGKPQNLTVYLVESEKISWQKDYRLPTSPPGAQDIEDYSHNHFLRATLTGTWGDMLTSGPAAANQEISKQFTYTIPAEFNMAKCKVIAVVNDPVNYRIIQAEETDYLQ